MFNIRVYGIFIRDKKVLLCEESAGGKLVTKFPGGGLEFGEGILQCLRREFREELDIEIFDERHFYTTDFFVQSMIDPAHQVISIYYLVDADIAKLNLNKDPGIRFFWIELDTIQESLFDLPIDKRVAEMLKGI